MKARVDYQTLVSKDWLNKSATPITVSKEGEPPIKVIISLGDKLVIGNDRWEWKTNHGTYVVVPESEFDIMLKKLKEAEQYAADLRKELGADGKQSS